MEIINGQNPNKVELFDLHDFVSKIKVSPYVLEHMEETNKEFDEYMNKLNTYSFEDVIHLWLIETAEELVNSSRIEKHYVDRKELLKKDLFFDTLNVSHKRIHNLHSFVMDDIPTKGYRLNPVRVSYFDKQGNEHIYWHGPEAADVPTFMNDFIDVYKSTDLSVINSNPFLKSALVQLLFIRIHPYGDGNGRTARVLHSIKFTDSVNKIYGRKLKLCPLNISASILLNQLTYVKILDNIYFDLEHDNNEYINKWFDFILNMADEQLNYSKTKLEALDFTNNLYADEEDRLLLKQQLYSKGIIN